MRNDLKCHYTSSVKPGTSRIVIVLSNTLLNVVMCLQPIIAFGMGVCSASCAPARPRWGTRNSSKLFPRHEVVYYVSTKKGDAKTEISTTRQYL